MAAAGSLAALLIGSAFFLFATSRIRHARTATFELSQERDALQREIAQLEEAARESSAAPLHPPASGSTAKPGPPDGGAPRRIGPSELIAMYPELGELFDDSRRANAKLLWGPLFKTLHLSPELAATFVERILDHERAREEAVRGISRDADPGSPEVSAMKARLSENDDRLNAEMRVLLGANGYEQFDRFRTGIPFWRQAGALASRLYGTDDALTLEDADRLVEIMITQATRPGSAASIGTLNWDATLAEAADVLSPGQQAALEAERDHTVMWRQLNRMIQQAR